MQKHHRRVTVGTSKHTPADLKAQQNKALIEQSTQRYYAVCSKIYAHRHKPS